MIKNVSVKNPAWDVKTRFEVEKEAVYVFWLESVCRRLDQAQYLANESIVHHIHACHRHRKYKQGNFAL